MTLELKLTKVDERLLWDYCTRLDCSTRFLVNKLVKREIYEERLLKEKSYKAKHVKVKEEKNDSNIPSTS